MKKKVLLLTAVACIFLGGVLFFAVPFSVMVPVVLR